MRNCSISYGSSAYIITAFAGHRSTYYRTIYNLLDILMSTSQHGPKRRAVENSLAGTIRQPHLYEIAPGLRKTSLCYCVKID